MLPNVVVVLAAALAASGRAHARQALYGGYGGAGTFSWGGILRYNGSGWAPVSLQGTVNADDTGIVLALAPSSVASSGSQALYAGGVIVDGSNNVRTSDSFVDAWNGTAWTTLTSEFCYSAVSSPCPRGTVLALAVAPGSNVLYAGGLFQTVAPGNVTARSIAQWNGAAWAPLGAGFPGGTVAALAVQRGALYAGGTFSTATGLINVARWDGTSWSALGAAGLPYTVNALVPFNGAMVAGGVGAVSRWSGAGPQWTTLAVVNGTVNALAVFNGALYAAGAFVEIGGGVAANNIARWDGTAWTALGAGVEGTLVAVVNALTVFNGQLVVGGLFSLVGGSVAVTNLAFWTGSTWAAPVPPPPSSINARSVHFLSLAVACDLGWTGAACALCAPGYTGAACTPCPSGTYKSTAGSGACTPCPAHGSTGGVEAATSPSQCICQPLWTGPTCDVPEARCIAGDTSVSIQVAPSIVASACIDVYAPAQYRWLAQALVAAPSGRAVVPNAALGGATSLIVEGYADAACTHYLASFTCAIVTTPTPTPTSTSTPPTPTPTSTCTPPATQTEFCCAAPPPAPGDGVTHVHTQPDVRCVLSPAQYTTPYIPDAAGNVNIPAAGATPELELYADLACTDFLRALPCALCC